MSAQIIWQTVQAFVVAYAPRVAIGVMVFLIFWLAAILLRRFVERVGKLRDIDQDLIRFLGQAAKIGTLTFGVVTALGTMGINVAALVAGLGLTGFALGFALKDIISNAVAGVLVIIYKPIKHNDQVSVSSFQGKVLEINLRYTVLQGETAKIFVPNSTLFTNGITVQEVEPGAASAKSV